MPRAKNVSCCVVILMAVIVIFLASSYKKLTPLEGGVRLNWLNSQISETDKPYTAGRHPIGFLYKFIVYPSTLQNIEFSSWENADGPVLSSTTKGGQNVLLELSFQYRLMLTQLLPLYRKYEKNYHARFVTAAAQALREVVTTYDTTDFFEDRANIAEVMHAAVNARMQEYFAVVEHFQLRTINVPSKTETTILDKLTKAQGVYEAEAIQASTLVRVNTDLEVSRFAEEAKIEQARATQSAAFITNQAQADAISIGINATALAYKSLKDELGFDNDQLIQYLYLEQIRNIAGSNKIAVNVDSAFYSM